ncbi:glycosyltransferase family 4 protein [Knoellia sp. 3-2P3]|uniref:glycosyltransferase family 4 protein n=1 Tax=unclassified Knoellia TaxID=2618719 RepID=UPI0023DADA55|nr:glycosyltransferase family 4 protein [Knoellia sp. 3-2P3]MDF2091177.1 glycosyltransferase family 4 protein [Knoellia sp. 3-2P3]
MTRPLFVTHTAAPSGAELCMGRLALALRRRGVDVAVTFAQDGPMVEQLRRDGVRTAVLSSTFDSRAMTIGDWRPQHLLVGLARLVRLGRELGDTAAGSETSVVVAHSTKALVIGAVAARRAGLPLVWHVHDRVTREYFGWAMSTFIRGLGWLVSRGYIANSRSTMDTLFLRGRPAVVVYPGIEVAATQEREAQRDPPETVIAVVGRLTRWKGQDVFLRAVAQARVRPARIYLVGGTLFDEDAFRDELEHLARALDLPVTFTGHVDDPQSYMCQADILVHCSVIAEPFGQVVLEGLQAGCAVIASRPGGPAEIVEPGVSGLLVDAGSQEQLTAALDIVIGDRALRERLSAQGRRRAEAFDLEESACRTAAFLESMSTPSRSAPTVRSEG